MHEFQFKLDLAWLSFLDGKIPMVGELRSASATSFHLSNRLRAKAQEVGGSFWVGGWMSFLMVSHGFVFWSVFLEGIYKDVIFQNWVAPLNPWFPDDSRMICLGWIPILLWNFISKQWKMFFFGESCHYTNKNQKKITTVTTILLYFASDYPRLIESIVISSI